MKTVELAGKRGVSKIHFGEKLDNMIQHTGNRPLYIITDNNVDRLYGKRFPSGDKIVLDCGESIKNSDTVHRIYSDMISAGHDRSSMIVGIGGGLVCDIAGFVASTYMRGTAFGFVPTTLLAQVDASIGGKNGINFGELKNMIGTFNQPDFILNDHRLLHTLSPEEFRNGIAETIKHGMIADAGLIEFLDQNHARILQKEERILEEMITRSAGIKIAVVESDETEKGERKKLNFGHTLGHAVELIAGMPHGEAVSVGMAFALGLSKQEGFISDGDYRNGIDLLQNFGLPVRTDLTTDSLLSKIRMDKKKSGHSIDFILLHAPGDASIQRIRIERIREALNDLR